MFESRLKFADYLVIAAFLMFAVTHVATTFYLSSQAEQCSNVEGAAEAVRLFEANPFQRYIFQLASIQYVIRLILLPALLFGTYAWIRRRGIEQAEAFAFPLFLAALLNVSNDVAVLLGSLA